MIDRQDRQDRPNCLDRAACRAITPGKHCRTCALTAMNRTPEARERSARNMRAKREDPAFAAKLDGSADRRNAAIRRHHANSAVRERMAIVAARGRIASAAARANLTYIPAGYRDLYRYLVSKRLMSAKEARAAVEEQRRTDARREIRRDAAEQRARYHRQIKEAY